MRRLKYCIPVVLALTACGDTGKATALYYAEQDQGGEAYRTRIIVTSRWLRIDEGHESRDFLLFDRREKTLHSVNAMDSRILVMPLKTVGIASPTKLEHRVERDTDTFPAVGGKKVAHYTLLTNRKPCYDLFAAEGMLPEAVQALREYRETLAGQQVAVLSAMPKELQTPCDLANNIFAPTRYLDYGLPVRLTETGARTSELVDFQTDFNAVPGLFELPASFRRLTLEDMRGR
ncbi:MAG: hypothetical protein HY083_02790 [Gammaproteobacteria bacterium]|nr:hypothetical protein [Gammaproteobacteria bacterium]